MEGNTAAKNLPLAFKSFECPICRDIFKNAMVLTFCGHSICQCCLVKIRDDFYGCYFCPQCGKKGNAVEPNFAVKGVLEAWGPTDFHMTTQDEMPGKTCHHVKFVAEQFLEDCVHCNTKFCQPCMLNHKVFLRLEAEIIASNFESQEELLNSSDYKIKSQQQLEVFCKEMKNICCDVIDGFQKKVQSHIETTFSDCYEVAPSIQEVDAELEKCLQISEIFLPVSKLTSMHNKVVELDQTIMKLKNDLTIPIIKKPDDIKRIRKALEELLNTFCNESLSEKVFGIPSNESSSKDYVPGVVETLFKAVQDGDLDTFKPTIENTKMPAQAVKYMLNCSLQIKDSLSKNTNDETGADDEADFLKHSLLSLAAAYDSEDIIRCLMGIDGVNLLEKYSGKTIVHHLLSAKNISNVMEKFIEDLLEKEPKLVGMTDSANTSTFQYVIAAESLHLCRVLVEKFGLDVSHHFADGSTALLTAIQTKSEKIFHLLLSLGADLTITRSHDHQSCLHEAFKMDWPYAVKIILSKHPEMLEWSTTDMCFPLQTAAIFDSLSSYVVLETWLKTNQTTLPHFANIKRWTSDYKSSKLIAYLG